MNSFFGGKQNSFYGSKPAVAPSYRKNFAPANVFKTDPTDDSSLFDTITKKPAAPKAPVTAAAPAAPIVSAKDATLFGVLTSKQNSQNSAQKSALTNEMNALNKSREASLFDTLISKPAGAKGGGLNGNNSGTNSVDNARTSERLQNNNTGSSQVVNTTNDATGINTNGSSIPNNPNVSTQARTGQTVDGYIQPNLSTVSVTPNIPNVVDPVVTPRVNPFGPSNGNSSGTGQVVQQSRANQNTDRAPVTIANDPISSRVISNPNNQNVIDNSQIGRTISSDIGPIIRNGQTPNFGTIQDTPVITNDVITQDQGTVITDNNGNPVEDGTYVDSNGFVSGTSTTGSGTTVNIGVDDSIESAAVNPFMAQLFGIATEIGSGELGNIENSSLFGNAQDAANRLMSGELTPEQQAQFLDAFENQRSVQGAREAKIKEGLINAGLGDSGRYVQEGVIGTANSAALEDNSFQRGMAAEKARLSSAQTVEGLDAANSMLSTLSGNMGDRYGTVVGALEAGGGLADSQADRVTGVSENQKDREFKIYMQDDEQSWETSQTKLTAAIAEATAIGDFGRVKELRAIDNANGLVRLEKEYGYEGALRELDAQIAEARAGNDFERVVQLETNRQAFESVENSLNRAIDWAKVELEKTGLDMTKYQRDVENLQELENSGDVAEGTTLAFVKATMTSNGIDTSGMVVPTYEDEMRGVTTQITQIGDTIKIANANNPAFWASPGVPSAAGQKYIDDTVNKTLFGEGLTFGEVNGVEENWATATNIEKLQLARTPGNDRVIDTAINLNDMVYRNDNDHGGSRSHRWSVRDDVATLLNGNAGKVIKFGNKYYEIPVSPITTEDVNAYNSSPTIRLINLASGKIETFTA